MYIFVQVIDDSDAITIFEIAEPVVVEVKPGFVNQISEQLINDPKNCDILKEIQNGDLQIMSKNIISMTSLLNSAGTAETSSKIKDIFSYKRQSCHLNIQKNVRVQKERKNTRSVSEIRTRSVVRSVFLYRRSGCRLKVFASLL